MPRLNSKPHKVGRKKRRVRELRGSLREEASLNVISAFLTRPVSIKLNGESTPVPALHAIVLQLLQQSLGGNARALRTLIRYHKFAGAKTATPPKLVFVESDYTKALAADATDAAND